jgi:hypothetical protein
MLTSTMAKAQELHTLLEKAEELSQEVWELWVDSEPSSEGRLDERTEDFQRALRRLQISLNLEMGAR